MSLTTDDANRDFVSDDQQIVRILIASTPALRQRDGELKIDLTYVSLTFITQNRETEGQT
jgi:hypothetical protein